MCRLQQMYLSWYVSIRRTHDQARASQNAACLLPERWRQVALHGFIKKTQKTPDDELAVARKRIKELKA
jgi:Phage derived protein Gp49-like (DUF891)